MSLQQILRRAGIIPVIEIDDAARAQGLAGALVEGGLEVAELTLRTPAALEALEAMKRAAPALKVGMGSIATPDDLRRALEAGADFLVSAGLTPALAGAAQAHNAPLLPGVMTPSELMAAVQAGFSILKFFPAEAAGGPAMLKAFAGPFADVRFCPTGGIGPERVAAWLALPNVLCVGGSWVAPRAAIAHGDWQGIAANARKAVVLAKEASA